MTVKAPSRPQVRVRTAPPITLSNAKGQEIFLKVTRLKREITEERKGRISLLLEGKRYKDLKGQMKKLDESRKQIEEDFDKENPEIASKIDAIREGIDLEMQTLTKLALEAFKKGEPFELVRTLASGKERKVKVEFRSKFQQSLW